MAATDASAANDAEDDDFLGFSAAELATFVAELEDARAETKHLTAENKHLIAENNHLAKREQMLSRLLDSAVMGGSVSPCHDCAHLRAELSDSQQSLASTADLLLHARDEAANMDLELQRLRRHCRDLEKLLAESDIALVDARSAVAASHRLSHSAARADPPIHATSLGSPFPARPIYLAPTSTPTSALPVRTSRASPPPSPAHTIGTRAWTTAGELNAIIDGHVFSPP